MQLRPLSVSGKMSQSHQAAVMSTSTQQPAAERPFSTNHLSVRPEGSGPREVHFLDALPQTKVGKIDYRELGRRHAANAKAAA